MSKFTPGPWKVDTAENYDERYIAITNKRDDVVVWWSVPPENFNSDLANANLIAAAPEMYEALLAVLLLLKSVCFLDGAPTQQMIENTIKVALAKADGEVEK